MVIYMDQHKVAQAAPRGGFSHDAYEDEILNAGWNPSVAFLFNDVVQSAQSPELPEDLSTVDVDAFLDRIYALATQV